MTPAKAPRITAECSTHGLTPHAVYAGDRPVIKRCLLCKAARRRAWRRKRRASA